ncbi:MAG TPA: MotA/TolQ/ExbB proton channel family protein [Verrucomicrobiales bacterium]|jgi:biopolymer transport protein ExbB|nr:MotA/TolQ/ExbB proton channel family protein [Verrucomicrobiales bacterium]HCL97299.1 MotA/TolQ/ExbB proton channel family protein [Verrucomicrobiales bacterium]
MNITSIRSLKTVTTVFATALITTPSLYAEDDKNVLERYVTAGGWPMILIGLLILALVALCVFNFMNLTKQKFGPDDLKAGLMEHMINCRIRSAIELGASHPSYLGRMMAYALPNVDARKPEDLGRDYVEDAIADYTINENRKSMTLINYISLIAQAAPMLGLFGTVLGMVGAFGTLASGDGSADPSMLAGDISVALLTTLWGLVTAIPSLAAYFFFKNKLNNLVADCHHAAEELLNASIQTVNGDAHLAKIPEGIAV